MTRIPIVLCPLCGRRMPQWRSKEGGCKPCVEAWTKKLLEEGRL